MTAATRCAGRADTKGSDVAQDPESIERDIERSRARLAEGIDAIADRVSPRRVAGRTTEKAKARLESVVRQVNQRLPQPSGGGNRPALGSGNSPDGPPPASDPFAELVSRSSTLFSTGTAQARELVRRKDPRAIAAAVAAATLFALVLRRRRR